MDISQILYYIFIATPLIKINFYILEGFSIYKSNLKLEEVLYLKYDSKLKNDQVDAYFQAILQLKDIEECYRFFEDICTVKEIQSIAQRLEVAKLLRMNKTYNEIETETGASTATISRINRSLNYGSDGYNLVLDRLGYPKGEDNKR